jgi:hypothetical protein
MVTALGGIATARLLCVGTSHDCCNPRLLTSFSVGMVVGRDRHRRGEGPEDAAVTESEGIDGSEDERDCGLWRWIVKRVLAQLPASKRRPGIVRQDRAGEKSRSMPMLLSTLVRKGDRGLQEYMSDFLARCSGVNDVIRGGSTDPRSGADWLAVAAGNGGGCWRGSVSLDFSANQHSSWRRWTCNETVFRVENSDRRADDG